MSNDQSKSLEKLAKVLNRFSDAASKSPSTLNEQKAARCLTQLQSMRLTAAQLQATGLAATVNRLRKLMRSDTAATAARRLVKDWRRTVEEAAAIKSDGAKLEEPQPKQPKQKRPRVAQSAGDPATAASSSAPAACHLREARKVGGDMAANVAESDEDDGTCAAEAAADPMRAKCREMLKQALELPGTPTTEDAAAATAAAADGTGNRQSPRRVAMEIESALFADFGASQDTRYKTRIRSLLQNLRDPKNPGLRHCILRGGLAGADVARMRPEQLASDDMKRLREKLTKDTFRQHQAVAAAAAEPGSSLFACKRCRKKNCTYSQLQTLSGDEPMTTYVVCNECGFRWKFN